MVDFTDFDSRVNKLTNGSMYYGCLKYRTDTTPYKFEDSSQIAITLKRKVRQPRVPFPKRIKKSFQPKLQVERFLESQNRGLNSSMDYSPPPNRPSWDSCFTYMQQDSLTPSNRPTINTIMSEQPMGARRAMTPGRFNQSCNMSARRNPVYPRRTYGAYKSPTPNVYYNIQSGKMAAKIWILLGYLHIILYYQIYILPDAMAEVGDSEDSLLLIITWICYTMSNVALAVIMFGDPGKPPRFLSLYADQTDSLVESPKSTRAIFWKQCGITIIKPYVHSEMFGKCLGFRHQRAVVVYYSSILINIAYFQYCAITVLCYIWTGDITSDVNVWILAGTIWFGVLTFTSQISFYFHFIGFTMINLTHNQYNEGYIINHFDEDNLIEPINEFAMSIPKNLCQAFGSNPLTWMFPWSTNEQIIDMVEIPVQPSLRLYEQNMLQAVKNLEELPYSQKFMNKYLDKAVGAEVVNMMKGTVYSPMRNL